MKRSQNAIKIGYVPRGEANASPHPHDYEITPDAQEPGNPGTTGNDFFPITKRQSIFIANNNAPRQEIKKYNPHKNHPSNEIDSEISSPPLKNPKQKQSVESIPTKVKYSKSKKVIIGIGIALLVATVITVPIVLGILLTQSSAAASTSTTTISPTVVSAYWSFDTTANDFYSVYDGVAMNGAGFSDASSSIPPFVGQGQALSLLSASSQYVDVSTSFFNLSSRSFTIQAWIFFNTTSASDRGIFGQCQCSTCANQCLYFITRSTRLHIGFTLNELTGTTDLSASVWYHVTFVYNYDTKQQILYINGVQDAIKSNAAAYQGVNGAIRIGASQVYSNMAYFNGYIDNVKVTTRTKTSDEILRDATLVGYYSFNGSNPLYDNGPNGVHASFSNGTTMAGRVGEAIRFSSGICYFQIYGVYNFPRGVSLAMPITISMWINPSSLTSSTFAQAFRTLGSSANCDNLLGISSVSSGYSAQLVVSSANNGQAKLTGPFLSSNAWTHISLIYNTTVGFSLYINGVYFGTSGPSTLTVGNVYAYFFLGYYRSCSAGGNNAGYEGAIDEVYIHNRELTKQEIVALASV